jgi:hypothetical protein
VGGDVEFEKLLPDEESLCLDAELHGRLNKFFRLVRERKLGRGTTVRERKEML